MPIPIHGPHPPVVSLLPLSAALWGCRRHGCPVERQPQQAKHFPALPGCLATCTWYPPAPEEAFQLKVGVVSLVFSGDRPSTASPSRAVSALPQRRSSPWGEAIAGAFNPERRAMENTRLSPPGQRNSARKAPDVRCLRAGGTPGAWRL